MLFLSSNSTPSYSCWATRMVLFTGKCSLLKESCCIFEVVNGAWGDLFFLASFIFDTINSFFFMSSTVFLISFSFLISKSFLFIFSSFAEKKRRSSLFFFFKCASISQYSSGTNFFIFASLSTTSLTATDCTLPAERPRVTFFQRSGLKL